ncbi:MAG TPA: methyltransferase domain-containing protein [Candidatus Acidoferrales bacterium]|nr:methyltransferase domain-containing protein [Candidatus Acidoferrales bacterium]
MKRAMVPELLDSDAGTPEEIKASITDLRMFNRRFGGIRTTRSVLHRIAQQRGLRRIYWLDVAGGSGDVATLTRLSLLHSGIETEAMILDRAATHMNGAHLSVCGDALALPFADASFDVVGCSLFAHHLGPPEIGHFVREGLRVARHAFFVHDLIRHPLHLALAYAGFPLYRSRVTRHDAPASVRNAYTVEEMRAMLHSSGAEQVEIGTYFLFRMGAIAWKPITI